MVIRFWRYSYIIAVALFQPTMAIIGMSYAGSWKLFAARQLDGRNMIGDFVSLLKL